ncbi:hypothetical protein LZ30DRAFT_710251 [Colletotrichum cereale]|nr:hypothetical protein LZ30DRAFT_710251 [Colletotrichum cereale]
MLLAGTFIFLTVLARAARGGSAVWQPQPPHDNHGVVITADASGYAVKNAVARRDIVQKRYLAMRSDETRGRWPERTISYCYESTAARGNLHKALIAASNLWKTAGLASDVYKYREVADPGTSCTEHQDRDQILVIKITADEWDTGSAGSATVGIPALDDSNPGYKGPEMYINSYLRAEEGSTRFIATIAHELGHVWGLYHEHQNKLFWEYPYSSNKGNVFGTNFHCARFSDYNDVRTRIRDRYPNDPTRLGEISDQICKFKAFAQDWHFSAADYLPLSSSAALQWPSDIPQTGATNDHVDWKSIMIYSGDNKLFKNNGEPVEENNRPSEGDIAGIRKIYDEPFSDHEFPTLASSTKSPFYTKWKDMVKKKLCK